ncbi:flagellar hook-length control protein FliK [Metabacillus dongyingensis]|uniref:flagellar hook-length control protein FliK n=1 Tax=Metabacillus dongyingensis TaxID=2874282 RepID=UPI003B8B4432
MKIPSASFRAVPLVQNSVEKSRNSASFQKFLEQEPLISKSVNSFSTDKGALPDAEKIGLEFQNLEAGIMNALQEIPLDEGFFKETPLTNDKVNELLELVTLDEAKAVQSILSGAVSMESIFTQLDDKPETVKVLSIMAGAIQLPDTLDKKYIEDEISDYISQKYPEPAGIKLFEKALQIFSNHQAGSTKMSQEELNRKVIGYDLDKETDTIKDSVSLIENIITHALSQRENDIEHESEFSLISAEFLHDSNKLLEKMNSEHENQTYNTSLSKPLFDNKSDLEDINVQTVLAAVQDAVSGWVKDSHSNSGNVSNNGILNVKTSLEAEKLVSLIKEKLSLAELSDESLRLNEKISSAINPLKAYFSEMNSKEVLQTPQMLELIKSLYKQNHTKGTTEIGLSSELLESRPQNDQVIHKLVQSAASLSISSLQDIQTSIKNAENIHQLQVQLSKVLLKIMTDGQDIESDLPAERNEFNSPFSQIDREVPDTLMNEISLKTKVGQKAFGHKSLLMENILQSDLLKMNNEIPSLKEKSIHSNNQLILNQLTEVFKKAKTNLASSGLSQMTIRLSPEHLGMLTVKLQQQHGEMIAKIITSTKSAKELVEQSIHQLKLALPTLNIQVDRFEVYGEQIETSFNRRHDENNQDHFEDDKQKEGPEDETETDSFKAHLNMLT